MNNCLIKELELIVLSVKPDQVRRCGHGGHPRRAGPFPQRWLEPTIPHDAGQQDPKHIRPQGPDPYTYVFNDHREETEIPRPLDP